MRTLSCGVFNDESLQEIWMQRLPSTTQAILSMQEGDLDQLVEFADKIHDKIEPNSIQVLSTNPLTDLKDFFVDQINSLKSEFTHRSRNKSPHSNPNSNSEPNHCWYHRIYKHKANKCHSPCTFTSENYKGSHSKRQMTPARK